MNTHEAQQSILNIIGGDYMERWPVTIINVIFGNAEYSYNNRRDIGTFLYGNVRDANLVYLSVCASNSAPTRRTTTICDVGSPTSRAANTTTNTTTLTCCWPTGTTWVAQHAKCAAKGVLMTRLMI